MSTFLSKWKRATSVGFGAVLVTLALLGATGAPATAASIISPVRPADDASVTIDLVSDDGDALAPGEQSDLAALEADATAIDAASTRGLFDYAAAIDAGADPSVAAEWARGVILGGGMVTHVPESLLLPAPLIGARAACRGENKIWTDFLGGHARFSSCVVPKVVSALQAGVGATALAATIATAASLGVGAVSAIVPAVMQYSAWSIDACSKNGTGVELAFAGIVCWAQ